MIKKILVAKIFIAGLLLSSCANFTVNDALVTSSASVGTSTGLRFAVTDAAKRTAIANYLYTYSDALRTITGNPTPAQLIAQINAFIPQSVKNQFPELVAFAVPLIVQGYTDAYNKWGNNSAKLYEVLGDLANGIEAGAAPFISPQHSSSP